MVTQTHHFRVLQTNSTRFIKQISTINSISAYSDARLKENIKSSKVNALESLNEIEMCSFDFIDRKYGAHSELGYIAQQLQKVIPECVVAVPQDKEQMGYDELLQVQDTHLIPYLVIPYFLRFYQSL